MNVATFIKEKIFQERLQRASVLAVYDPDRRYHDLCKSLVDDETTLVDASEGSILARENAMLALANIGKPGKPKKLLVYVPVRRPVTDEERQKDPFAVYSACGAIFPDGDGDSFLSLCLRSKPDHDAEIRRIFAENSSPTFTLIDSVGDGLGWPTLRFALQAESAREILLALLAPSAKQLDALNADESWVPEAKALLSKVVGLKLMTKGRKHSSVADELWRFMLFSEFAFDLPAGLPTALTAVPRAPAEAQVLIQDICDTLRGSIASRSDYITRAEIVEGELELPKHCADLNDLGVRDTFPFEERTFLANAARLLCVDDVDGAKKIVSRHGQSVWIGKGENQAQWSLVDTALRLAEACEDIDRQLAENGRSLEALFGFYTTALQDVDRLQREFEQAVGDYIPNDDSLADAIDHARKCYAKFNEQVQALFFKHIETTGWPAQGRMLNANVFDKLVEPILKESGRRVAFIMVDALRYELGVTLHRQLADAEQTEIHAACALLPTVTPVGMASLLPGAAAGLRLSKEAGGFAVTLDGTKLSSVTNRMEVFRARYGDRFAETTLDGFVRSRSTLAPTVELLVLRSVDIDAHLENTPTGTLTTLNLIHQSLRSIRIAVNKLKIEGFTDVVIATDHGFVLNAHAEAGDLCIKPAGDWVVVHDRALLGEGDGDKGNFVLSAEKVGVRGDFRKLGGPRSMAPYRRGLLYFHGGASLQEAVVPVITVKLRQAQQPHLAAPNVTLTYKNGARRVTTRLPVVDLSVEGADMFALGQDFEILLEAYDKRGGLVGEAKRGGAVDGATGTVTLKPGAKAQVTVKMALEFEGKFTLKALNPVTLSQYAAIDLETDYAV